jgi:hypothetical protein
MSALDELIKIAKEMDNVIGVKGGYGEQAAEELAALREAVDVSRSALNDIKEYYVENNLTWYVHTGRSEENPLYTVIREALAKLEGAK